MIVHHQLEGGHLSRWKVLQGAWNFSNAQYSLSFIIQILYPGIYWEPLIDYISYQMNVEITRLVKGILVCNSWGDQYVS